jgi:cytochrome c-type biogenesis protein
MSAYILSLLAGVLSTLSPCVLPLLPIILTTAVSEHRYGPVALAGGLAISFVTIGLFVATLGHSVGVDGAFVRTIGALLLIAAGAVLLIPRLQTQWATLSGPLSSWTDHTFGGGSTSGLGGQFGLGLLLGAVWSPCVGPTLGAASVLASRGEDLGHVAAIMTAFGVGAALPLLALSLLSREKMLALRNKMLAAGGAGKILLGLVLLTVGVLILTGFDKAIEAALVQASPDWLTELTTRY